MDSRLAQGSSSPTRRCRLCVPSARTVTPASATFVLRILSWKADYFGILRWGFASQGRLCCCSFSAFGRFVVTVMPLTLPTGDYVVLACCMLCFLMRRTRRRVMQLLWKMNGGCSV